MVPDELRGVLLEVADDELIIGWRDSEWTGIAPVLEEDVAFSSIAQNEIGHARAIYSLLSDDPDALAFDRRPEEYRCSAFVELRFVPDWAHTIARRYLYEEADAIRIARLAESGDEAVAGLAAKIQREEAYHHMHAEMWAERLRDEPRFRAAVDELLPHALGMLAPDDRPALLAAVGAGGVEAIERGAHDESWPELWEEMTMVRRSEPAGVAW
jgi:ring-1,2-phenylacetyl-CoA epoxidase subunit PaaC